MQLHVNCAGAIGKSLNLDLLCCSKWRQVRTSQSCS